MSKALIILIGFSIFLLSCKKENETQKENISVICDYSFVCGDTGKIYHEFNPALLIANDDSIPSSACDTFEIGSNSVKLENYRSYISAASWIGSLNDSLEFAVIDTLSGTYLKFFNAADQICHNNVWKTFGYFMYWQFHSPSVGFWWSGTGYAAIRLKSSNGFKYGWVKLDLSKGITVLAYGLEN